jgi:D-alanyl-D-alanine carboxypeptidase
MAWLDVFTGDSVKDAAAQNAESFAQLKKEGMGYLNKGLKSSTGAINTGMSTLSGLGDKYGAATDLYLDALGANGPEGATRAQGAFTAGPGYQWMVDQAIDAVNRGASARGMTRSGNTMADTVARASGLAGQEYNNWLNNLSKGIAPETAAAGGSADLSKSLAGLYQNDANARVNLASNVTGGIANQNSMAANAEMQGSGNLWNFGLNTLKTLGGIGGYGGYGGGGGQPAGYNWNGTGFLVDS